VTGTVSECVLFNRAVRKVFWEASHASACSGSSRGRTPDPQRSPPSIGVGASHGDCGVCVYSWDPANRAAAQNKMKMHLLVMAKEVELRFTITVLSPSAAGTPLVQRSLNDVLIRRLADSDVNRNVFVTRLSRERRGAHPGGSPLEKVVVSVGVGNE
jgi:hypothetical protein